IASFSPAKRSARMNRCSFRTPSISLETMPEVWYCPSALNGVALTIKPLCSTCLAGAPGAAGAAASPVPPPNKRFRKDMPDLQTQSSRPACAGQDDLTKGHSAAGQGQPPPMAASVARKRFDRLGGVVQDGDRVGLLFSRRIGDFAKGGTEPSANGAEFVALA